MINNLILWNTFLFLFFFLSLPFLSILFFFFLFAFSFVANSTPSTIFMRLNYSNLFSMTFQQKRPPQPLTCFEIKKRKKNLFYLEQKFFFSFFHFSIPAHLHIFFFSSNWCHSFIDIVFIHSLSIAQTDF